MKARETVTVALPPGIGGNCEFTPGHCFGRGAKDQELGLLPSGGEDCS